MADLSHWEHASHQVRMAARAAAEQRVAKGEAWLNEHVPQWWHPSLIPVTHLDMADPNCCMFGWLAKKDLVNWFGPLIPRHRAYSYADCVRYIAKHELVEPEYQG